MLIVGAGIAAVAADPASLPTLDTRPAFMLVVTNISRVTNAVVVTNYLVVTNITYQTNLYNAQGQLLQPVAPAVASVPGLIPIVPATPAPKPAEPDPAVLKSNQVVAVRELLNLSLSGASNVLSAAGTFAENTPRGIRMPEGVTSFDRKKSQAFLQAMNTAAAKALPDAIQVAAQAVSSLNPTNPASIVQGTNGAATAYLLTDQGEKMSSDILAVVRRAAAEAGVREAYQAVMLKGGGLLGAVLGSGPAVDTDAHITKGLTDAIFEEVKKHEAAVRAEPSGRGTKTLQEALKK